MNSYLHCTFKLKSINDHLLSVIEDCADQIY